MAAELTEQPGQGASNIVVVTPVTVIGKAQESPQESEEEEIDSEGEDHYVGCCACCNCGPKVPNKTVKSRSGETLRYNFKYTIEACCGVSDGLQPEILEQVPEGLAKKGLSLEVWKKHTGQLRDINKIANEIGQCPTMTGLLLCSPLLLLTGCCCCYFCKLHLQEAMKWDNAFRAWQGKFNEELEPLGIFVKTQSTCYVTRGGKGEKHRHIHRWIAFAMTPRQIEKLKSEAHITGDTEDYSCCGGINEADFCMHPN